MKKITIILSCLLIAVFMTWSGAFAAALTTGQTYTITIQKMGTNGAVTDVSTSTAVADADGKLSFDLTGMLTNADCNFIVFIVKDANGLVVRKGFVPAPPAGSTNQMGINDLSTAQTEAILAAGVEIGTDDPIAVAYLITMIRNADATAADIINLAKMGKKAIINGFEPFLTDNGITATQLATFKSKLIYNDATVGGNPSKTIADLTKGFKTANNSTSSTTSKEEMQKAGGLMADVFMDAALASGIDIFLILAAHDAAGVIAEGSAEMAAISTNVKTSMSQSMTSFYKRIAIVKVKNEYSNALTTLGASGAQVDRFNTAIDTLMAASSQIDADYALYFTDPAAYMAANNTTADDVRAAIDERYQAAFRAFQGTTQGTGIISTDAEITTMQTKIETTYGISDALVQQNGIGKYYDFGGTQKNWPIPQTVMVSWMADTKTAGGYFDYVRDTTAVPTEMVWMKKCSDETYWNQATCEANGKTWAIGRRTYAGIGVPEYAKFMGLQEDLGIIDFSRYVIYMNNERPTRDQEQDAKKTFFTRINNLVGNITGKTNATTDMTTAQKKAIIKLLMQPSMD